MKTKYLLFLLYSLLACLVIDCSGTKNTTATKTKFVEANDTLHIENKELEYEVIIIEPGFNGWLASQAQPRGFYSQSFMENKNILYVNEWNARVMEPQKYNPRLYELRIDYSAQINYGYEVNYLLYNYFIFFQNTYKQPLFGNLAPR